MSRERRGHVDSKREAMEVGFRGVGGSEEGEKGFRMARRDRSPWLLGMRGE